MPKRKLGQLLKFPGASTGQKWTTLDASQKQKSCHIIKDNCQTKTQEKISYTKNDFKCHECEFICKKKVTFNKHINTKHGVKTVPEASSFECSICEDKFKTKSEFLKHKKTKH